MLRRRDDRRSGFGGGRCPRGWRDVGLLARHRIVVLPFEPFEPFEKKPFCQCSRQGLDTELNNA